MIDFSISPAYSRILGREVGGWGRITYYGLEYVVNRGGIAAEDEPRHVDYAFPFTCEYNARCEGEEEEWPDYRKHGLVRCMGGREGRRERKKVGWSP